MHFKFRLGMESSVCLAGASGHWSIVPEGSCAVPGVQSTILELPSLGQGVLTLSLCTRFYSKTTIYLAESQPTQPYKGCGKGRG